MSVSLFALWLPILLGTFLAWIASALIHMALKYHNADYYRLQNEDEVRTAIRKGSPPPGLYPMPYCMEMSEMASEAVQKKYQEGPVAFLTVFPNGLPNMGKLIGQQVLFFLVGSILIAYGATLALVPGAPYGEVFRFVSTIAFLAFGWAIIPYSIWYGHQWKSTFKYLFDALVYALLVAGSFAWLWPSAS